MFTCLFAALLLLPAVTAPRNVVLMVADGAGFAHFAAALGDYGDWPVQLAMCTVPAGCEYRAELAGSTAKATDSAAAITAMTTGVKTVNGRLAVGPDGERLTTLAEVMAAAGKATGVVTTVPFVHATPAGFAISHPDRAAYGEIARQMLLESPLTVIMGAGHPWYDDSGREQTTARYAYFGDAGLWQDLAAGRLGWSVVAGRGQFIALAEGPTPARVFGLPPAYETLQEQRDGDPLADAFAVARRQDVPTLAEMARAALNVVDDDPDGFCLLIEGGAVDWAGHHRRPGRLAEEMTDFDQAVRAVVAWLAAHGRLDETLLVVTSDHETCVVLGEHTNALVPLYARGPGAEALLPLADQADPVHGPYVENSELGELLSGQTRIFYQNQKSD